MSTSAEYKKRENFEDYIEYHRELVYSALALKKVCPTCEDEDSHYKCSKCHSVTYCSKKCQVTDWPNHKKICQIFHKLVEVVKDIHDLDLDDLSTCISDALWTRFQMHGFEAELTCVTLDYPTWGTLWAVQAVVLQGRLYDAISYIAPSRSPLNWGWETGNRKVAIRPIPSHDELTSEENNDVHLRVKQNSVYC